MIEALLFAAIGGIFGAMLVQLGLAWRAYQLYFEYELQESRKKKQRQEEDVSQNEP